MSFLSFEFLVFLVFVFLVYWGSAWYLPRYRNWVLLAASYFFYGWSNLKYLHILVIVSLVCYGYGKLFVRESLLKGRRWTGYLLVALLLGILSYYKYTNFLLDTLINGLNLLRCGHFEPLDIALPLGISFYFFQCIGYVLDVQSGKESPECNVVDFCVFAGFFPVISSGPIERKHSLLAQIKRPLPFDYDLAVSGCRQMLWGYLMKMVLADNCAEAANRFLNNPESTGAGLWVGMTLYTFQIYGDFAGYSNIAIGIAKLFGIRLSKNFDYPYFSQNTVEFWQRWHITLNTWFRDYLYIPLGGNRVSYWRYVVNCLIVFGLSGLWHGANWTFVCWGLYNAVLIILFRPFAKRHQAVLREHPFAWHCWLRRIIHFGLMVLGWTFFRASSFTECRMWLSRMFSYHSCRILHGLGLTQLTRSVLPIVCIFVLIELFGFCRNKEIQELFPKNGVLRWILYAIGILIIFFIAGHQQQFIYFNF